MLRYVVVLSCMIAMASEPSFLRYVSQSKVNLERVAYELHQDEDVALDLKDKEVLAKMMILINKLWLNYHKEDTTGRAARYSYHILHKNLHKEKQLDFKAYDHLVKYDGSAIEYPFDEDYEVPAEVVEGSPEDLPEDLGDPSVGILELGIAAGVLFLGGYTFRALTEQES